MLPVLEVEGGVKIEALSKLGAGASADVWRGRDEIGRDVAIKIIRPDDPFGAQAVAHAKALAQVDHPNIVRVFSVERISDPEGGSGDVTCIVMELIEGRTLEERLRGSILSREEARAVGKGILAGMRHMVDRGIAHGDLHAGNIMTSERDVKVIDILYVSGASHLSATSFQNRMRRDLLSLRLLLQEIVQHSQFGPSIATRLNDQLAVDASLENVARAFDEVTGGVPAVDLDAAVSSALERINEEGFVDTPAYATALAEEIPREAYAQVLVEIIAQGACRREHAAFVTALWRQLQPEEGVNVLDALAQSVDSNVPKGRWAPALLMLHAFGAEGWAGLRATTRLRLEGLIANNTLAGHVDIYSPTRLKGGVLGTWANTFYPRFSDRRTLANNLASLLRQSWYTQNYVGEYFMPVLPYIADTAESRKLLIEGLATAVRNDARIVKERLGELPGDWQKGISDLVKQG